VGINDNSCIFESFSSTNDIEKDKIKSKASYIVGGWMLEVFSDGGWKLDVGRKNIVKNLCICHPERVTE